MSCLFPGAKNYDEFWTNLLDGKNSIQEIPVERFDVHKNYSPDYFKKNTTISKWAGLLEDIKNFDHNFFRILPDQAKNLDPQCRLLLQEVWHCLEDAAVKPEVLQKAITSVYIGFFSLDHFQYVARAKNTDMYGALGNYPCMLANRVSHFLNLRGASISIDSACASSFSALHHAKLALSRGECEYSVIGAVNLISHVWHHISMSKCRVLSPDGQCKTFDASANGYVRGEGVGCLLVTTLENAIQKGHRIHAIIKGSSINHCGNTPAISTPSAKAQKEVVNSALEDAEIGADQIGYIETHGTGTALGDAIECSTLAEIFSSSDETYIGSVKTNIGHLEAAAGIAGIIKGVMMLNNHIIPQHLNCQHLNPLIDFASTRLRIPFKNTEWSSLSKKRCLGISSMGFGGVNGHIILQEYIKKESSSTIHRDQTLPCLFSAKTKSSLEKYLANWQSFIQNSDSKIPSLADIVFTLSTGRSHMKYRAAVVIRNREYTNTDLVPKQIVEASERPTNVLLIEPVENLQERDLQLLLDLVFSIEGMSQYESFYESLQKENEKKKLRTFLYTCLVAKAYIQLDIVPNLILGKGIWQIAALFIAEAIDFGTAATTLFRNEQVTLEVTPPRYLLYQESSDSIYYPCEENWDFFVNELKSNAALDIHLYNCIQKLLPHQFALTKYIRSLSNTLQGYGIDLESIFTKPDTAQKLVERDQVHFINLAMLLSINFIFRKHKIPPSMKSNCQSLNYLDFLVGLGAITTEEVFKLLQNPENFKHIHTHSKYVEYFNQVKENPNHLNFNHSFEYIPSKKENEIENIQIKETLQSAHVISTNIQSRDPSNDFVHALVGYWLDGVSISWDKLVPFLVGKASPACLPGYAFDEHPFWYEIEEQNDYSNESNLQGVK